MCYAKDSSVNDGAPPPGVELKRQSPACGGKGFPRYPDYNRGASERWATGSNASSADDYDRLARMTEGRYDQIHGTRESRKSESESTIQPHCPNILRRARVAAFLSSVVALGAFTTCPASEVGLAWDPVPDSRVAVYQLYYGVSTKAYHRHLDTSAVSAVVGGLDKGRQYYFAVRACTQGLATCSAFSNEICAHIPHLAEEPIEPCGNLAGVPLEGLPSRAGWRVILGAD